jgi:hypothetical protein
MKMVQISNKLASVALRVMDDRARVLADEIAHCNFSGRYESQRMYEVILRDLSEARNELFLAAGCPEL